MVHIETIEYSRATWAQWAPLARRSVFTTCNQFKLQHKLISITEVTIPLHLIPLLVETAFLLISETCIHAIRAMDIQSGNLRALAKFDFPQVPSDRGKSTPFFLLCCI